MSMRVRIGFVLLLVGICIAAVGIKPVILEWDYPTVDESPDLVFKLYHSPIASAPLANWVCLTNIPGTNRQVRVNVEAGKNFFYLTASNWWGESTPSNVASTPALPRSDMQPTIKRGW